jgi:hypothetical protein
MTQSLLTLQLYPCYQQDTYIQNVYQYLEKTTFKVAFAGNFFYHR